MWPIPRLGLAHLPGAGRRRLRPWRARGVCGGRAPPVGLPTVLFIRTGVRPDPPVTLPASPGCLPYVGYGFLRRSGDANPATVAPDTFPATRTSAIPPEYRDAISADLWNLLEAVSPVSPSCWESDPGTVWLFQVLSRPPAPGPVVASARRWLPQRQAAGILFAWSPLVVIEAAAIQRFRDDSARRGRGSSWPVGGIHLAVAPLGRWLFSIKFFAGVILLFPRSGPDLPEGAAGTSGWPSAPTPSWCSGVGAAFICGWGSAAIRSPVPSVGCSSTTTCY